jgi:hypothetical protein
MMMKNRFALLTVLIAVLIVAATLGCSPYSIKSDFDRETNYTAYRSFAMHEGSALKTHAELIYDRVARAITREMEAKGYQEAAPDQADILIAVHASTWTSVESTTYGYRYRWPVVDVQFYDEGTLVIDIVDKKTNEMVWRGAATGVLSDNPGQDEQKVAEVVGAILAKYPPH